MFAIRKRKIFTIQRSAFGLDIKFNYRFKHVNENENWMAETKYVRQHTKEKRGEKKTKKTSMVKHVNGKFEFHCHNKDALQIYVHFNLIQSLIFMFE